MIALSDSLGYKPEDVNVHGQRQMLSMVRTNERVDMESPEIAEQLWQKLQAINMLGIVSEQPIGVTPFFRFIVTKEIRNSTCTRMVEKNI